MTTKFACCLTMLTKVAEEPPQQGYHPILTGAKVIGSGLLGMAGGYLAGAGTGKLLEHVVDKAGGNSANVARKVLPVAGGALGILYPMWKAREQQEIRDALASTRDTTDRGLPG